MIIIVDVSRGVTVQATIVAVRHEFSCANTAQDTFATIETMGIVQSRAGESDGGVREVFIGGIKGGTPLQSYQPSLGMGSLGGPHARSGSVRGAPRQPMPDAVELERRFTKVLVSEILDISTYTVDRKIISKPV